ncbi:MAG: methyltransferase domain-containing protein [Sphingomonas sp.]|uniref:methyltransferase n=1 Tax=Sphingomonas sp. TaxID=28214 RepID=UPI0035A8FE98|nr:methyltransferase domain-containing protein [Sphingomonas sp.]
MKLSRTKDNSPWRERWVAARNRVLADPGFQRFAARFPLTRPIVRSKARIMFDRVAGFTYSQVIAASIELRLLDLLADGARNLADIAVSIDVPIEGTDRLLRAAASIGLVERIAEDRWALGGEGAALRGNGGIAEMVAHHRLLYADLADPVALLRRGAGGGQLSNYWTYAESEGQGDGDQVAAYSGLMAASQPLIATHVIDSYAFGRHRRMLDVGGGQGAFIAAVAARVPGIELALFDLPAVGERARRALDAAGHGPRVTIHGGNFLADSLPGGHDLVTLIRVLHDHDDAPALQLLRNIHAALPPGGRLLIAEPMAETPGAEAAGDGYFGMYLWAMGSGRPRSKKAIAAMLRQAGFSATSNVATPLPLTVSAIVASR